MFQLSPKIYIYTFFIMLIAAIYGYIKYLEYDREEKRLEVENAKTEIIVQEVKAKVKEFEAEQKAIFETFEEGRHEYEINDTIGYHTIIFD